MPNHFRSGTAAATITVVAGDPPTVAMAVSSVKVNPTQARVVLAGAVDPKGHPTVTLLWTSSDVGVDALDALVRDACSASLV